MSDFDLTISGNKAILDNMAALESDIQVQAQAKLVKAGEMAKEYAEQHAAVSDINTPGYVHMRDQMYVEVQPGIVTVGNDSDHAIYVELGTHKMQAQPFLVPAMVFAGDWLKGELGGLV